MRDTVPARLHQVIRESPCWYCGDDLVPNEVDHMVPVSRGGTSEPDDLAAACYRCNREKIDFTPAEWRAWREKTGRGWPPPHPWRTLTYLVQQVEESTLLLAEQLHPLVTEDDYRFLSAVMDQQHAFPDFDALDHAAALYRRRLQERVNAHAA